MKKGDITVKLNKIVSFSEDTAPAKEAKAQESLKAKVQTYLAETTPAARIALLDDIMQTVKSGTPLDAEQSLLLLEKMQTSDKALLQRKPATSPAPLRGRTGPRPGY